MESAWRGTWYKIVPAEQWLFLYCLQSHTHAGETKLGTRLRKRYSKELIMNKKSGDGKSFCSDKIQ